MEKNKNILNEEQLRELIKGSKLQANANLQHRIMHQINAEYALKPKKIKSTKPLVKSVASIAAVFYILILALCAGTFYLGGLNAFASKEFILAAAGISVMCIIYGLIIVLDEKRFLK